MGMVFVWISYQRFKPKTLKLMNRRLRNILQLIRYHQKWHQDKTASSKTKRIISYFSQFAEAPKCMNLVRLKFCMQRVTQLVQSFIIK